MKYLIANWKSHKTLAEAKDWLDGLMGFEVGEVKNVVCTPMPFLVPLAQMVEEKGLAVELGVQDVSPFPFGTYTGAVAAGMLKGIASYAIVGHSERRRYFHETNQEVANKVDQCVEQGITPIVCVDEPYARQQIAAIDSNRISKCLFAYEPLEHISDGVHPNPDDPAHAQEVAEQIEKMLEHKAPVLYGGSANSSNIKSFVDQPSIQGALVGGASLEVREWKAMLRKV